MDARTLIITILIGAVAGWLAGQVFQGRGLGTVGNIIVGIIGGFVGSWLLGVMGVHFSFGSPLLQTILTSTIGAVVVLFLTSLVKRA